MFNSLRSLQELRENSHIETASGSREELCHVLRNIFWRWKVLLEAGGQHFWDSSMKWGKLKYKWNMDYKFLRDGKLHMW